MSHAYNFYRTHLHRTLSQSVAPRVHRRYQQPLSSSVAPQVYHPYNNLRRRVAPHSNIVNEDRSTGPVSIRDLMKSRSPKDQVQLGHLLDNAITERNRQPLSKNKGGDALNSTAATKSRLNPDAKPFSPQQSRQSNEFSSSTVPQAKFTLNPNVKPFVCRSSSAPTPTHDSKLVHTAEQQEIVTGVKRKHGEPKVDDVVYCNTEKEEEDQQPPRKKQWTIVEFYLRPLRPATFVERGCVSDIVEQVVEREHKDTIVEQVDESENKNVIGEQVIQSENKSVIGEQAKEKQENGYHC